MLGLQRVKKSEFVLRCNIPLFAGHAIGANPAIPRMFPNMFPLVTSQVYFLFLFANSGYAMQCFFIYFTHSCFFLKLQLSMYSWYGYYTEFQLFWQRKLANRRLIAVMKLSLDKSAQGERISGTSKNDHISSYRWRS